MALFRRPIPRRAFVGAALGALYAMLLLMSATIGGVEPVGVFVASAWLMLSMSLLFLTPLAYHTFTTWAILWVVIRSMLFWRSESATVTAFVLDDLLFPAVSAILVMTSGYLPAARAAKEEASSEPMES